MARRVFPVRPPLTRRVRPAGDEVVVTDVQASQRLVGADLWGQHDGTTRTNAFAAHVERCLVALVAAE